MEINSGYIEPNQFWQEVQEVVALFHRFQIDDLVVFYGFGCDRELEVDELYRDIEMKTDKLLAFLSESIAKDYYRLGEDNFYIQSRSLGVEFLLCHESDIHLETENVDVAGCMKARWSKKANPGYEKIGGEWVSLQEAKALKPKA